MRRTLGIAALLLLVACGVEQRGGPLTGEGTDRVYGGSGLVLERPGDEPQLCFNVMESLPPQCSGIPLVGWSWSDMPEAEEALGVRWVGAHVKGTWDGERLTLTAPPRSPDPPRPSEPLAPACEEPEALDASVPFDHVSMPPYEYGGIPEVVALWVNDPSGDGWDGPYVFNVAVRPGAAEEARAYVRGWWRGHLCVVEWDQPTAYELDALHDEVNARLRDVIGQKVWGSHADHRAGVVSVTVTIADEASQRRVDEAFGEGRVRLGGQLRPVE